MKQVINDVAEKFELTKKFAAEIVEFVNAAQVKEIKEAGKLKVAGLGTFSKKVKPARKARNPKTGEEIQVAEKTVVAFKMAKDLKESL